MSKKAREAKKYSRPKWQAIHAWELRYIESDDDDLVIPTTSVSTPAVGRIVSNETPRPFPIDDIEAATN